MRMLRKFLQRLFSWTQTGSDEMRLAGEIEEHIALQTEQNIRSGLSPVEARRRAVLKFGSVESMREDYRERRGLPFLETLARDIRHSLRLLRHAPAFTITTVLTLALGIGATTSIFTLVHAVLLKSLPVAKPSELYRLGKEARCCYQGGYSQDNEFSLVSYDLYKYLRDNTKGFSELAAFPALEQMLGARRSGNAEAARTYPFEFVSGNYFAMFGIGAFAGRALTPDDDRPSAQPAAMMSYRLWQQRYGSDASVIGTVFNLDDKPFTLVGIAPPGFFGGSLRSSPPDFFLPLNTEPYLQSDSDLNKEDTHWLNLIGRVRPGANPDSVEAEMRVGLKQWLRAHWGQMSANDRANFANQTLYLRPGGSGITGMREEYEHWLKILMAISGFVLLIVCANIAGLMLVRSMEQRRRISLSMALGARVSGLIRQSLTESLLLSLLGGVAGLLVAFAGTRLILALAFPAPGGGASVPISASPSMAVLLFAFATSLVTGVAFGVAPAWMAARVDPMEVLRGTGRSTVRAGSLPRKALVILQASLSLVLLSTAGLLTAALHGLQNQDFGFQQDRRIVVNMNPRLAGYQTLQLPQLYQRIRESMEGVPGVSSVALCLYSPQIGGAWGAGVKIDGHAPPRPGDDSSSLWNRVTAGYFDVIGTPIVRGRGITRQDTATSQKVAVINEAFARKYFPNEDPIGKYFGQQSGRQYQVVGVARNARYVATGPQQPEERFFFLPATQADYTQTHIGALYMSGIVILSMPGAHVSNTQLLQAMASVDPKMPVVSIQSLREQVAARFTQQSLIAHLASFFGILSLVLVAVGLYGITAYNAGCRTSEIGVRMALGADRGQVVRLIIGGALALTLGGLIVGLPLMYVAGRILGSQLYGTHPYDPTVILTAIVTLCLAAMAASAIPAFRASRISPLDVLRTE